MGCQRRAVGGGPAGGFAGALAGGMAGRCGLCHYFGRRPRYQYRRHGGRLTGGPAGRVRRGFFRQDRHRVGLGRGPGGGFGGRTGCLGLEVFGGPFHCGGGAGYGGWVGYPMRGIGRVGFHIIRNPFVKLKTTLWIPVKLRIQKVFNIIIYSA